MKNKFEFIEFSHLHFELQCQVCSPFSVFTCSSKVFLLSHRQTGRWNISMITIIRVSLRNNEIGSWVKTLSAIDITPLLKMKCIDLRHPGQFYRLSQNKSPSIEDQGWILKTFFFFYKFSACNIKKTILNVNKQSAGIYSPFRSKSGAQDHQPAVLTVH